MLRSVYNLGGENGDGANGVSSCSTEDDFLDVFFLDYFFTGLPLTPFTYLILIFPSESLNSPFHR